MSFYRRVMRKIKSIQVDNVYNPAKIKPPDDDIY